MRESAGARFTAVTRVALLGLLVAAAWLILSLATAPSGALATDKSNAASLGLFGYGSDEPDSPLHGLLSTVTKPVAPVVKTVLDVVDVPGETVADLVDTTPVVTVVEGVTDALGGVTGAVAAGARELVDSTPVGGVVGLVTDTLEGVTDDLVELVGGVDGVVDSLIGSAVNGLLTDAWDDALDIVDGVDVSRDALVATTQPLSTPAASQISPQGTTGHLWPASQPPDPWSPIELILTGSGSLTNATSAGGATTSSDLPYARSWFAVDAALGDRSPNDDLPGSPTFDTDSTPD